VNESEQKKQLQFDHEVLRKKLARGEQHTLKIVSNSMEPLIKVGEEVVVCSPPKPEHLQIFDILVFSQGNRLNAHFLTKVDWQRDHFVTRPLRDPSQQDYPISFKDIIGIIPHKKIGWWQKLRILLLS
jgi:signal peptidase I